MKEPELQEWPDCPKWARASEGPGWICVVIYGGGMLWAIFGLLSQGRLHELIEPDRLTGTLVVFGWGTLFLLLGIWLIVTVRRARRIMTRISARNRSEE